MREALLGDGDDRRDAREARAHALHPLGDRGKVAREQRIDPVTDHGGVRERAPLGLFHLIELKTDVREARVEDRRVDAVLLGKGVARDRRELGAVGVDEVALCRVPFFGQIRPSIVEVVIARDRRRDWVALEVPAAEIVRRPSRSRHSRSHAHEAPAARAHTVELAGPAEALTATDGAGAAGGSCDGEQEVASTNEPARTQRRFTRCPYHFPCVATALRASTRRTSRQKKLRPPPGEDRRGRKRGVELRRAAAPRTFSAACVGTVSSGRIAARVRALIRRAKGHASAELACGDVVLDTRTGSVTVSGKQIELTAYEFRVLAYLIAQNWARGLTYRTHRACLRSGLRSRFQHNRGLRRPAEAKAEPGHHQDRARTLATGSRIQPAIRNEPTWIASIPASRRCRHLNHRGGWDRWPGPRWPVQ